MILTKSRKREKINEFGEKYRFSKSDKRRREKSSAHKNWNENETELSITVKGCHCGLSLFFNCMCIVFQVLA